MNAWPDHWVPLADGPFAGPVAIFDMDGVLSDATHRQSFLHRDPPDWDGFGSSAHLDPPLPDGRAAMVEWGQDHRVLVVTARPIEMRFVTVAWLHRHGFDPDLIVFRAADDTRPSPDVKQDELIRIQSLIGEVVVAYEDEARNIDMYRTAGIDTVAVHSGYYDHGTVEY